MSHLKSPRLRPQKRTFSLTSYLITSNQPPRSQPAVALLMENFNIADTSLYTETLPSHPSIPVHTNPPRENENEMEFSNKWHAQALSAGHCRRIYAQVELIEAAMFILHGEIFIHGTHWNFFSNARQSFLSRSFSGFYIPVALCLTCCPSSVASQ